MGGLSRAIGKIRAQCSKASSEPRTPSRKTIQANNIGVVDTENASETSFHSAAGLDRSPSSSPALARAAEAAHDRAHSVLTVEIPKPDSRALSEYKSFGLDSEDEHVNNRGPKLEGVGAHPNPSQTSTPRRSERIHTMNLQQHEDHVTTVSESNDIFEDKAVDRKPFSDGIVELEDPYDDDWVPHIPNSQSRSTHQTLNSRAPYHKKSSSSPITSKSDVLTSNSPALAKASISKPFNNKTIKTKKPSKKGANSEVEVSSDIEITFTTPRNGQSIQYPIELDSDVEVSPVTKDRKQIKPGAQPGKAITSTASTVPANIKVVKAPPVISCTKEKKSHIDLTMLSSSESSGDDLDHSNEWGEKDPGNSEDGRGSSSSDKSSRPDKVGETTPRVQTSQSIKAAPTPVEGLKAKVQPQDATHAARHAASSGTATGDGSTSENDIEMLDEVRREMSSWEMFNTQNMPAPYAIAKFGEPEVDAANKVEEKAEKLSTEIANNDRWLRGEPYIPYEKPAQKRGVNGDVDNEEAQDGVNGIKDRFKRRKLDELAWTTVRDSIREGLTPRYVCPKRYESNLLFASRLLEFKLIGWKKQLVVSKQRKIARRARMVSAIYAKRLRGERGRGKGKNNISN